jgi:hypothetical protein
MTCMSTNVMIDAFLLLRREGVFMRRMLEDYVSGTSANQSTPDSVLLNKMCDKNGQRAPLNDRAKVERRAWDAVVQVAPRSGGFAELRASAHYSSWENQWTHNV